MKFSLLIISLLLVFSSCKTEQKDSNGENENSVVIEGIVSGGEDQLVTIDVMGPYAFEPVDSVRCNAKGAFRFETEPDGLAFYAVKHTSAGYITLIVRPGERISIKTNADTIYPYAVEGSEHSELARDLATKHAETLKKLREITGISEQVSADPDFSQKKMLLNQKFDSITSAFQEYSEKFIREHPESPSILFALYNQFGPGLPVFDPLDNLDIYLFTDSALFSRFPENEAIRALHSELQAVKQQLRNTENQPSIKSGVKAPDFVIHTADGGQISLKELRGNYVLLQIWASWSPPSVEENRILEQIYQDYKDKGLVILQISLDDSEKAWRENIGEKKEDWYHASDLKRWESIITQLYDVNRIPANFLINPGGIIVEMNIFGSELIETMNKYMQ